MSKTKLATALVLGMSVSLGAHATNITSGALTIDVDAGNGNLDEVFFSGNPYYDLGFPSSDWGMQTGTDTSTFTLSTNRSIANPFGFGAVNITAGVGAEATGGSYTAGGANVGINRSYNFVSGFDAFITMTSFNNMGADAITLRFFETYDPDQGPGSSTSNDVFSVGSGTALTHINGGLAGLFGDLPSVFVDALGYSGGFGLSISSGTQLNSFFTTGGVDPNGAISDIGFGAGWEFTLGAGESIDIASIQCYGDSVSAVASCYRSNLTSVPEPATLALFGLGLLGLRRVHLRRR